MSAKPGGDPVVLTQGGESVDEIAWRAYGRTDGETLRALWSANPGLAAHGETLPAGLEVRLPRLSELTEPVAAAPRIWD